MVMLDLMGSSTNIEIELILLLNREVFDRIRSKGFLGLSIS